MKYQKKRYQNIKFPSLLINQLLNNFINQYKNGELKLYIEKTENNICGYRDLSSFFNDYERNHYMCKIEYLILNVLFIKIEYNKQHTNIYMLYLSEYDFNTLINPLEKYIELNKNP
ncbi:TPA: hypothetical protein QCS32_005403 [Bacillus thuringiensis]|uniref:Uncharacterized protein n=1 Tax=Bacillus thuringiensis serovar iberica TaxID=180866 RepID=A0A9X6LEH5_BACTU|nr:hypothetical protein [Bacillus thuringiensis]MEB9620868.1 hypothetical protein [Bacillus cereus]OUB41103.1 hypothetical protein BK741_29250 [Bacillus thuringiensis serovar iberica]HDR5353628.1 hypothetical protein [Bacillus thuringiensis]